MQRNRFRFGRLVRSAGAAVALVWLVALAGVPAGADDAPALRGVVNLNTATPAQLEMLPGIGAARARAVVEARDARGGFQSVDDLLAVKGIGEASLAKLRPHLAVDGETTLQPAE